jgi:hypothetical protein
MLTHETHLLTGQTEVSDSHCRLARATLNLTVLTQEEVSLTCNQRIPANNKLGLSVIESCVCKLQLLFYVAFYLVRDLNTFDFILVINQTPNKWHQWTLTDAMAHTLSRSKLFL